LALIFASPLAAQVVECPAPCQPVCWPAGIYPTVLTPWCCTGWGVDKPALTAQIQYQLDGGVHGLLLLGSLGEGQYATMAERVDVITTAVATTGGRVPIVVGIHSSSIKLGLDQLRQAKVLGAQAVLVKYTGPRNAPFCDVLMFFQALAGAGELPVFYYHYPDGVDRPLTRAEVIQVLNLDNVVGAKESTLDLKEIEAHMRGAPGKIFFSGTALNLTQFQKIGGHGAMSPEAAILPADTVMAYETAYGIGDRKAARAQQRDLFVLAPLLKGGFVTERAARHLTMTAQDLKLPQRVGRDESQARLKATLNYLGIPMSAAVKPPLPALTPGDDQLVRRTVRKLGR
jgi:4-hydroxy-tetrahydrodipicolinate synthase